MLYHLFEYLQNTLPGARLMTYLSFRSITAAVLAMLIVMIFGKKLIEFLQRKQIGETIRDLGLEGQMQKKGTPTMGGIIILAAIIGTILLVGNLSNIYCLLMLFSTIWLGLLGFLDDYIKVFRHNKEGLDGKWKIVAQVILGAVIVCALFFGTHVSTTTTIPFVKTHELDYAVLCGGVSDIITWIIYAIVIIFIITACSNGVNLTDGLDGLAAGTSAIVGVVLGVFAYLGGNTGYSDYLNIMYIPGSGEIAVYMSAFVGALLGFLWYNSFPAQIFMGDTGSLALGGIIGVAAVLVKKELILPVLCGIFLMESLSVIIQRAYFKYTKKKYGQGRRIWKMTPLHHHYQKEGIPSLLESKPLKAIPENKIVVRFWIIGVILAVASIALLKIR